MDAVAVEVESPLRETHNSFLHRQTSKSFSNSLKLASPGGCSPHSNNIFNLYKDLDKFTRYFITKTVQVIVQSRIDGNRVMKHDCKPNGNDWFNINITDVSEISDKTKAVLDCDGFSIRSNWRVCCEISLQSDDNGHVVLEHWIISNRVNPISSPNSLTNNQISPKGNRSSSVHSSNSNNGNSSSSSVGSNSNIRLRTATFSNTMRKRLNSIDDCPIECIASNNKFSGGSKNDNFDIKASTSCFSLSTASASQSNDSSHVNTSPTINSMSNNPVHGVSTNSNNTSQPQNPKISAITSIYTIYNRMSLLLKTLITTTHILPVYKIAKNPGADSVIGYRVYVNFSPYQNQKTKSNTDGSPEDVTGFNLNQEIFEKRSSLSNLSNGSFNIKEIVDPADLENFCPIIKIGSIKTEVNELDVSVCYRTDMKSSNNSIKVPRSRNLYDKILDDDCLIAAKQLLYGNDHTNQQRFNRLDHSPDHEGHRNNNNQDMLNFVDQPLRPAFATQDRRVAKDSDSEIIESAFEDLLKIKNLDQDRNLVALTNQIDSLTIKTTTNGRIISKNVQSEPIQVPSKLPWTKNVELQQNISTGSTPKSLTDSFVFVDLNPPFASGEQNDINSFFHGPSPTFSSSFDHLKDVNELTKQFADIEANADQIDDFVDNICISEDEDEDEEV